MTRTQEVALAQSRRPHGYVCWRCGALTDEPAIKARQERLNGVLEKGYGVYCAKCPPRNDQ